MGQTVVVTVTTDGILMESDSDWDSVSAGVGTAVSMRFPVLVPIAIAVLVSVTVTISLSSTVVEVPSVSMVCVGAADVEVVVEVTLLAGATRMGRERPAENWPDCARMPVLPRVSERMLNWKPRLQKGNVVSGS